MKKHFYLVTIKGHDVRHYSKEELDERWEVLRTQLKKAEWSDVRAYEVDTVGRMHLHCYCQVGRKPFFPKFQKPGWSIHFQPFPPEDLNHIYDYITVYKNDPCSVEARFVENKCYHEYCFNEIN